MESFPHRRITESEADYESNPPVYEWTANSLKHLNEEETSNSQEETLETEPDTEQEGFAAIIAELKNSGIDARHKPLDEFGE